jgi:septal ring factor EnvC (AmiA/AmiB activator)
MKEPEVLAERDAAVDKWIDAEKNRKICDDEIERLKDRAAAHQSNAAKWSRTIRRLEKEIRDLRAEK